jgi:predicted nucleotidyltransferase component of viral defense system
MNQLYWNTITEEMRAILGSFSQSALGGQFYLAGGTALSLQLGHRSSADLDFFTATEDVPRLSGILKHRRSSGSCTLKMPRMKASLSC